MSFTAKDAYKVYKTAKGAYVDTSKEDAERLCNDEFLPEIRRRAVEGAIAIEVPTGNLVPQVTKYLRSLGFTTKLTSTSGYYMVIVSWHGESDQ